MVVIRLEAKVVEGALVDGRVVGRGVVVVVAIVTLAAAELLSTQHLMLGEGHGISSSTS